MKERVLMLGGQIDVVSSPGTGTAIKVSLPDHQGIPTFRI
jgi:signal transduction histidine kinase